MGRFSGTLDIVAVGRLRTSHWLEAQRQYLKRLEHYNTVRLIEVKDALGKGVAEDKAKSKEGERLLAASESARLRVILDTQGTAYSSEKFAEWLRLRLERHHHVAFVIGGPAGLCRSVKTAAAESLSLSKLTLPHEFARVLLLEQLYRACTILNNESYHK